MSVTQPQIENWSKEDVHHWLITKVKVDRTIADTFVKEEVLGKYLVDFEKEDILELGIKYGPAVKIAFHLGRLKEGSQHEPQFPAYVSKWTKEQVTQWVQQHVSGDCNFAQKIQDEDVSGDCLVCFTKQDLSHLDVRGGPAVKILKELNQLNNVPEPILQPAVQASKPNNRPKQKTKRKPANLSAAEDTQRKGPHRTKQTSVANRKQNDETSGQQRQITLEIQNVLDDLEKETLKVFQFNLQEDSKTKGKPIPRSKLEGKDTVDIATLMTNHYGSEEALQVTLAILRRINQRNLALQLERKTGQPGPQHQTKEVRRREANQGDKLKNLLTCGGNSLDNYEEFVVVLNKSSRGQIEYLEFLSKLKLFCVLDFDPDSASEGGVCHSYRKTRAPNMHFPSQYHGPTDTVIKELSLNKQISWIFCNGRNDLNCSSHPELDYKNWMRRTCRDVEQVVSFICAPEIFDHGRILIVFLLLSPVQSEKDPVVDTYRAFLKHIEEENIVSVCPSQSIYEVWRDIVMDKCECDIERLSIYELNLSEINGTIMALGPNQSAERLLPSSDSSVVVLKQKNEDLMTSLDILCLNQCEDTYNEISQEFRELRIRYEEEFYRGGKVKWWNFYFCDQKPFIKRDKYDNVKGAIKSFKDSLNICDLFNLFHHPGCGGTTLAMHVMWDLRKDFRCAVLRDNMIPKEEIANHVIQLMKLESDKPFPVLLLVDDSKDTEKIHDLVRCIRQAVQDCSDIVDERNYKVIILNCVRSQSPKEQYKLSKTSCQYITASLTPKEQKCFEVKLLELKEIHEKPENFYSFMIMKSNFDQKYIDDLAHNTLKKFDISSKEGQLFAFLALLNTYVAQSEISLSLSLQFLGMKIYYWMNDDVLDRMQPYSHLLLKERVNKSAGYKGIRILHQTIASACLEDLEKTHKLAVSYIVKALLHCDLFFHTTSVKDGLMWSIRQMLIERQRKKDRDERETFSSLINKIHSEEGRQTVQEIFMKAFSRFETSASIPQALARYLYIYERDFPEALKWAEQAQKITTNVFVTDTVGQVHKANLKAKTAREKQARSHNPEDLDTNIQLAEDAIRAFKTAQNRADTEDDPEDEPADDDSEDSSRTSYTIYGHVGVLEIAFIVFEMLERLPFFDPSDPLKKRYLLKFLQGTLPITSVYKEDNHDNDGFDEIIKSHEPFLQNLKNEVKETFEHLEWYFTYTKGQSEFDLRNHRTVCIHFEKYVTQFITAPEDIKSEQKNNPQLNLKMDIEERRLFLEKKKADTFAGIIQCLDKPPEEIEQVTECYAQLHQNQTSINQKAKRKETINYILANIILNLLKPTSASVKNDRYLSDLLQKMLQDVGLGYPFPDPYYLALLLLWPSPTEENTEIGTYLTSIRIASRKSLSRFRKRNTISHFYLGKDAGLRRLISKPILDKSFRPEMPHKHLAELWWNGDIFKEKAIVDRLHRVNGTVEGGELFANYGCMKIPVRPARIGRIRSGFSTERVSFYIGFAINGPLAYDIQYEN